MKYATAGACLLILATQASAASFDCAKGTSATERLICSDPELSATDDKLAALFRQAKAAATDKKAFTRDATARWTWREHNCTDKACLLTWYATRTAELRGYMDGSPPLTAATTEPQASQLVAQGISVSARDLYAAYTSNELAADSKYKGKTLKVSGVVVRVGRELLGDPYVSLAADGYGYQTVAAYVSKNSVDELSRLNKGMSVTLTCKGGGMALTIPTLDCH